MKQHAWMFLVLNLALASAMLNDEDTVCCDDEQHFEDSYQNVIEEDKDQDIIENPDQQSASNSNPFKMGGGEKKGKPFKTEDLEEKRKPSKLEGGEKEEKEPFKMEEMEEERKSPNLEGEKMEREPKQLQFSRLMERSVLYSLLIVKFCQVIQKFTDVV